MEYGAKVFTTVEGAEIEIGHYGRATNSVGVDVPERVAREMDGRADLRVTRLPSSELERSTLETQSGDSPYRRSRRVR